MRISRTKVRFTVTLLVAGMVAPAIAQTPRTGHYGIVRTPRTFRYRMADLEFTRQRWLAGDPNTTIAVDQLLHLADSWLSQGPWTVMDKPYVAISGDKHDFLAIGVYLWPNPLDPNGPWVLMDGQAHPGNGIDFEGFGSVGKALRDLGLAYWFTGDETYAAHAALLLRTWFLDPATKMNPNGQYSKVSPGTRDEGFAVAGFDQTFRRMMDGIGLLEASTSWTPADTVALKQWCCDYLNWMQTSTVSLHEGSYLNNHGSHWNAQMALLALYVGDPNLAHERMLYYADTLIPAQFALDGSQPLEMPRSNNRNYHFRNIRVAMDAARYSEFFPDIDLWTYETPDGRGIRKGLEFLMPYATETIEWDLFPGAPFEPTRFLWYRDYMFAAVGYDDPMYRGIALWVPGDYRSDAVNLTHPYNTVGYPLFTKVEGAQLGTIQRDVDAEWYAPGAIVTLTATTSTPSTNVAWTGNVVDFGDGVAQVTMDRPQWVTASFIFRPKPQYRRHP